jgi:RIP metalloprotease RseP
VRDPLDDIDVSARRALLSAAVLVAAMILGAVTYPRIAVVVAVVLSLLVIILLHEAAHFVTAKRAGMKVTEFFVGFGPRLWSTTRGETEYGIKAFPLGGYCKIIGMTNLDEVAPADEPRAYRSKNYLQKVTVAGAGSAMHFALATMLMFAVLVFAGDRHNEFPTTTVSDVSGPAQAAGIRDGDIIRAIDGQKLTSWDEVHQLLGPHPGDTVPFVVERGERVETIDVPLGAAVLTLGAVAQDVPNGGGAALVQVIEGGVASDAGFEVGDVITAAGGEPVRGWDDLARVARDRADDDVDFELVRDGKDLTKKASLPALPTADELEKIGRSLTYGFAGIAPVVEVPPVGVVEAVGKAPARVAEGTWESVKALGHVFSPTGISEYLDNLSGRQESDTRFLSPVGFAQVANKAVEAGWVTVLSLLIAINVFVGLFNLVPLLPFDGGHIAIATYERIASAVRHRRVQVDVAKLLPITAVVMAVLGFIFLSSLFLDITRPITTSF